MRRRLRQPLRLAAAVASVAATLVAMTALGAPQAATAASSQTIAVDGTSQGRVFDGVGALSAGASSRLLMDYPPAERSAILDYLFEPDYGASLQILKVEIGGDVNSTDGTELSHETQQGQVDCNTGYEWWLMEQAKKLNPNIKLYGLEWGAPGWVGAGTGTVWTTQNIDYLLDWLGCASQHGLTINYLGGWNEHGYNAAWYEQLRQALDANGYSQVQIVADDSSGWGAASAAATDPQFNAAVSIFGDHYPCAPCTTPSAVQALDKPLWASENGSAGYDSGAAQLAREVNNDYVQGQMTATINWSLIWSAYSGLPFNGDGLMLANTPWSGSYQVGLSIWVMAHTAQFTSPGWQYLDSGSVPLSGGGSVVSLRSPTTGDWSSIAETVGATRPQQVTYQVSGGLSAGPVQVWATNLHSGNSADWFNHVGQVQPQDGSFSLTLQPGYLYTVTTTTGQSKGTAVSPPAASMSLPYGDNFNSYSAGSLARYISDLGGAFQVEPCADSDQGLAGGNCLQQMVTQQPVQWQGMDNYGVTVVGDPSWTNYQATVDAMLEQPGYVELDARASAPGNGLAGYHFRISDTGQWSIYSQAAGRYAQGAGEQTTLASGTASFGTGTWHALGLTVRGDEITATLDGQELATVLDNTYAAGQVALETSPWVTAQFDNLRVTPQTVPSKAQGPALSAVSPNPVTIPAPGDSAALTAQVSNPGSLSATAVSATLQVPSGWTTVTQAPASLTPGQSAPLSWNVTAPADAIPGAYQATAQVTYTEGPLEWTSSRVPVTIHLAIVPQNQMTATASSYQPGYPPSNAIDGNPNTMWHTPWTPTHTVYPPQSITLNLGGGYNVSGLTYLPRQDGNNDGIITSYQVLVSQDGTTFTQVAAGNWANDTSLKEVTFPAVQASYVELVGVQGDGGFVSAAEINVMDIGSPAS